VRENQTYKLLNFNLIGILILGLSILQACSEPVKLTFDIEIKELQFELVSYNELDSAFNSHQFNLDSIVDLKIVPPVYVESIRKSIKEIKKKEKKRNFIRILLSYTLKVNKEINETRFHLHKVLNKDTLQVKDSIWLDSLCTEFRVKKQRYAKLIDKIDVIPPSLIIVQGIIESGWGTSNYAIKGNNLFGLHGSKGKNSIKARYSGVRVQAFDNIYDCVREYIFNLNRNRSYSRMRKERTKMRELGLKITGKKLSIYSPGIGTQGGKIKETIANGSDFLIVGRTILNSKNPANTAKQLQLSCI